MTMKGALSASEHETRVGRVEYPGSARGAPNETTKADKHAETTTENETTCLGIVPQRKQEKRV